ncbi:MAG: hypothetical protein HY243_00845 [Proteobacteria bacterium]|nr:hypothetical protein [Pseudomonadota bacterium]
MRLRAALSAKAVATAFILVAGFGFCLAVNLPGHLSYDSVIQLVEARTAAYAGWHPPFMSWLLGLTDALVPGTSLFVILNLGLFFASLLSLLWLVAKPSWLAAVVAVLLVLTPQVLLYQGIVWKDVLFANESVAAFVCLALAFHPPSGRSKRKALRGGSGRALFSASSPKFAAQISTLLREGRSFALIAASLLFFLCAALTRQNGMVLLPVGAIALGIIASRHTTPRWKEGGLYALTALVAALLLFTAANVALGWRLVRETGSIRQIRLLEAYDLIGALTLQPDYRISEIDKTAPALARELRGDGVRLYSPEREDPIAASQKLQDTLANTGSVNDLLANAWRDLIFHHPLLYLRIRGDVFRWVFLTPDLQMCLPVFDGVSGPPEEMAELGLVEREDDRDDALTAYASAFIGTPLLSHAAFAFLAVIELILLWFRRRSADIAIGAMLVGALTFTASFFVISIACDYRYLYFLDLSALTGLFYVSLDPRSFWPIRADVSKKQ